jgi:hypothetical protein
MDVRLDCAASCRPDYQHYGCFADMLYQVPAKPPTTDLTVFLGDALPNLD